VSHVLYFTAEWCNPCERTRPVAEELRRDGVIDFIFVDADTELELLEKFEKAMCESPHIAIRILFWARNIRSGAGERQVFRYITEYMQYTYPEILKRMLPYFEKFGRWDDMLIYTNDDIQSEAYSIIFSRIEKK
jgi:thiol-disulfide isomerase/thioredoxin